MHAQSYNSVKLKHHLSNNILNLKILIRRKLVINILLPAVLVYLIKFVNKCKQISTHILLQLPVLVEEDHHFTENIEHILDLAGFLGGMDDVLDFGELGAQGQTH